MDRPFEKKAPVSLKEEFADIGMVLQEFFNDVDEKTGQGKKRLFCVKDRLSELKKWNR